MSNMTEKRKDAQFARPAGFGVEESGTIDRGFGKSFTCRGLAWGSELFWGLGSEEGFDIGLCTRST